MTQVYVKYNPYRLQTEIRINGREISKDSALYKLTQGKRLQEWVGEFPQMLRQEYRDMNFQAEFFGMALDWDDFQESFQQAAEAGKIAPAELIFRGGQNQANVTEKIIEIFHDLQDEEAPVDDFRTPALRRAFQEVNDAVFPINVIATMSSGKSTVINALLRQKLMPSKNEACTATITELLDNDTNPFVASIYGENNELLQENVVLSYEFMEQLNEREDVQRISARGSIPFLDSRDMALELVDTPGPNNSRNQAHKNMTYHAINNNSNSLILYVLNSTQLSTNDDAALLEYVADQIRKGGKQVRDRFLFVINQMDRFNPDEEDIEKAIQHAREYLASYGIDNPQLFPCSALVALNLRTHLNAIDVENLSRQEERKLSYAARDTLAKMDLFLENPSMHLEIYSTLTPSAAKGLQVRLKEAEERGDSKEQVLIHSGICSIEEAIRAYVKKYAHTKKVKDLVETFSEILESHQVLAKAKAEVASSEAMAKACEQRAVAVCKKIDSGEEAALFKERIAALDPLPVIKAKAKELKGKANRRATRIFQSRGDYITDRNDAKRLVTQFGDDMSDVLAQMTANLEEVINTEIVQVGERLLEEYQNKLLSFDQSAGEDALQFQTLDLIRGELTMLRDSAKRWTLEDIAYGEVDAVGEKTTKTRTYYEKVGVEEEEVLVGSHQEKIGTKKVLVGTHKEKTGSREVRNSDRSWWQFWKTKYVTEPVYTTVNDYEDQDVYETVQDYETIYRDVFEERTETIEKFRVEVARLQAGLTAQMSLALDKGIKSAVEFSKEQIADVKAQFTSFFDHLDQMIKEKYQELEECTVESERTRELMRENQRVLDWLQGNIAEIDSVLDF